MLTSIVLCALLLIVPQAGPTTRLTGTWIPDLNSHTREKARKNPSLHDPPIPAAGLLLLPRVRILDQETTIDISYLDEAGKPISSLHLTPGGNEDRNEAGEDTRHLSRTKRETNGISTEWRMVRGKAETIRGVNTWTLSEDGNSLIQISSTEDQTFRTRTRTNYSRLKE